MRSIVVPRQEVVTFGQTAINHRGMTYSHYVGKTFKNYPINLNYVLTFKRKAVEEEICIPQKNDKGEALDSVYVKYPIHRIAFKTGLGTTLASANYLYWTFETEKERDYVFKRLLDETCISFFNSKEEEDSNEVDVVKQQLLME